MNVKIYRGNQIGGCVTEITSSSGTRIVVDAGSNLPSPEHKDEPELPIAEICEGANGVFITHYHGDHIGLLEEIPSGIPVYMGRAAKAIFRVILETRRKDTAKINAVKDFDI